jgi:predicted RNase H-like HicB family nuclease
MWQGVVQSREQQAIMLSEGCMVTIQHTVTAVYQRSGEWWAAWIEELPGANTQGATLDEARANLREAAALILEEGGELIARPETSAAAGNVIREPLTIAL